MTENTKIVIFDRIQFLGLGKSCCSSHSNYIDECYKVTSSLNDTVVEMSLKCGGWTYADHSNRPKYSHNLNADLMSDLREKLVAKIKYAKEMYYITAYKNLNLVRDNLHSDILLAIVNFVHNLRQPNYLESVEI